MHNKLFEASMLHVFCRMIFSKGSKVVTFKKVGSKSSLIRDSTYVSCVVERKDSNFVDMNALNITYRLVPVCHSLITHIPLSMFH
jgi:hypothetical protein